MTDESRRVPEPGPFAPGAVAPLAGPDGRPVLDENGEPVMVAVVPPDSSAADLPPGTIRRRVVDADGWVHEHVTIGNE